MESRDFAVKFIDVLRLHPCLWNVTSDEYYNAEKKAEAMERLIEVSRPYYKEADADFVSKKVLHLKTVVRRVFRKIEKSTSPSGEATYIPSLWYYDHASFLAKKVSESHLSSDEEYELPEPSLSDSWILRKFTNEEMMQFVDLYRRQECLWNQRMGQYRHSQSRERAYREIRRQFGGTPPLTLEEVKAKIKGIRTTYNQELAKVLRSKTGCREEPEGAGPYHPKLGWYRLADSFLRPRSDDNSSNMKGPIGGRPMEGTTVVHDGPSSSTHLVTRISPSKQIAPSPHTESGMPRRFNSDKTMKFLDLYQKHQCLWDPIAVDYKDAKARRRAVLAIAHELGCEPPLSYVEVKNKIKGIRTIYSRELCKLMSGSSNGTTYKPTLPWFNRADSFLRNVRLSKVQIWSEENVPNIDEVRENFQEDSLTIAVDESPSHSPELLEYSPATASGYTTLQSFSHSSPQREQLNTFSNKYTVEHLETPIKVTPRSHEQAMVGGQTDAVVKNWPICREPSNTPELIQGPALESPVHPSYPVKLLASKMLCDSEVQPTEDNVSSWNEEANDLEDNETPVELLELELSTQSSTQDSDLRAKELRKQQNLSPESKRRQGRKRKKREKEDCYSSVLKLLEHKLKSPTSSNDGDRFDLAARCWASTLRELRSEQQIYAERLISEVLFEAQLGNLDRNAELRVSESLTSALRGMQYSSGSQNSQQVNTSPNHHHHQKSFPQR